MLSNLQIRQTSLPRPKSATSSISFRRERSFLTEPKPKPKYHFRCLVKLILELSRLNAAYSLKNKVNDEIMPIIQDITFSYEPPKQVMFDPREFKADRQFRVPDDIKRIMSKESFERTEDEIKLINIYLRRIDIIREYPIRMQYRIAKYGVYERFDPKRIIVRQGHRAASFYIILSGSVIVIVMSDDRTRGQVVAYLNKGQSFGELAIIHKTARQSTVVAKEDVEFLSISIKDFHEIFMSQGIKMIMDPDYETFISNSFLGNFPKDLLANNPDKFFFQYFRSNEILSRNTNNSKWIYLVKSGQITVIYLENRKNRDNDKEADDGTNILSNMMPLDSNTDDDAFSELNKKHQNVRTVAEDYDLSFRSKDADNLILSDTNWIQIQIIRKGDAVGLAQCFYDKQPRLLLLSNGVEVYMMEKKFFLNRSNCNDLVKIKNMVLPYPTEDELQSMIKEKREWNKFKKNTLKNSLKYVSSLR